MRDVDTSKERIEWIRSGLEPFYKCNREAIDLLGALGDERDALVAERDSLPERVKVLEDGGRPLPITRETLGRMVREAWVRWAETQPSPKPSWLVPYDELAELDKEADRQIGEAIARWTLIHAAATRTKETP